MNSADRSVDHSVSTCRHCRHYTSEGRRGGHCSLLEAPVQGSWAACVMAVSPFAARWQELEELMALPAPEFDELPAIESSEVELPSLLNPAALDSLTHNLSLNESPVSKLV